MSEHTTFKVGGPADLFVTPEDPDEVREVLLACDEAGVSRFVMGRGSDLLVSDDGYRGVIVSLAECLVGVSVDGTEMACQAGVDLREASEMACELGLSGLEFACGIPGSIGGACFMNAGAYVTGSQLKRLGEYYAHAINDNFGLDFDVLFGPAYKGIPLAVTTAIALHDLYGKEVRYCSDRKEEKDHGADKGGLLGTKLADGDRVVMIEDVTTSGKSIDETYPKVTGAASVEIKGLIVSLNRMEVGKGGVVTAQQEIQEKYGFPVASIVSMADVVEALDGTVITPELKAAIDAYYEQYGVK